MLANYKDIFLTPEEAEDELGVHVLGLIPQVEDEKRRLIRNATSFAPQMESYRSLRTNIHFATIDHPIRTLLVTSSVPAEGKSTVLANLAMALAMENKKVIVVDTDLRRPTLHKLFETDSSPGVTDVLVGNSTVAEALHETTTPLVRFIPAGPTPHNPTELIGSPAMTNLLEEVSSLADIVLLDSPPVLAVADSLLLANGVDGVLMVISEETLKRNVHMSLKMLSRAKANVIGTTFNHIQAATAVYYYSYYTPTETQDSHGTENTLHDDAGEHTA